MNVYVESRCKSSLPHIYPTDQLVVDGPTYAVTYLRDKQAFSCGQNAHVLSTKMQKRLYKVTGLDVQGYPPWTHSKHNWASAEARRQRYAYGM